jgi:hypothetical protein
LGILCARGAGYINGYGIYASVDVAANWSYIGNAKSFTVYGTLLSTIAAGTASMIVTGVTLDADIITSASSTQAASDTLLAWIGNEIVSISTVTQGPQQVTVSMLRGRCGTVAATHAAGTPVHIIQRAGLPIVTDPIVEPSPIANTALNPAAGAEYLFRLPQRVALKTQLADDVDDRSVHVNGLYRRPLPVSSVAPSVITEWDGISDISVTVGTRTWRTAGYPSADFYEAHELQIVPVIVDDTGVRYVLAARDSGQTTIIITAAEITTHLGSTDGYFAIELFTFFQGRHSATALSVGVEDALLMHDYDGSVLYDYDGTPLIDLP